MAAKMMREDDWHQGHMHSADQDSLFPSLERDWTTIDLSERIKHLTWAWFIFPLSTGALALLYHDTPHRFEGLHTIGKVVFILQLILFVTLTAGIAWRFFLTPPALALSLTHPTEGLFFPAFLLNLAIILANISLYGVPNCGPWLPVVLKVCFWIYVALALLSAIAQFSLLFLGGRLPVKSMTPVWILPIFPATLCGTLSSIVAESQPPESRTDMIIAGVIFQGHGFLVTLIIYPLYFGRLMQEGFPQPGMRPALFIAAGPPSFTTVALIGLAEDIPGNYRFFEVITIARDVLRVMALFSGIFIWTLALWFFGIAVVSILNCAFKRAPVPFSMAWWGAVFPNVGFSIATSYIGEELESEGITWLSSAMAICVTAAYLFVAVFHVRAIYLKKVLYPGRDEDKNSNSMRRSYICSSGSEL